MFEVIHENRDTLMVFITVETQWRREIPAMSDKEIWRGLRYEAVEAAIHLMGFKKKRRKAIFAEIVEMERAALPILRRA